MSTDSQQVGGFALPEGARKNRHTLKCVITTLVILAMSACSNDEPRQKVEQRPEKPPQAIVVQIPAAQLPLPVVQPQYITPPQPRPQPVETDSSNPWAVKTQPERYGQYRTQQWGQPEPPRPQYTQPATGSRYRPLDPVPAAQPRAPVAQQAVPLYRPVAPYDRLSGSSFGTPAYPPYGGRGYPGYYPAAPGGAYAPAWPGMGWPGYW
ncbi:hypothetical protein DFR30_1809 [Thiogranum longum]|uniref:Uncharacterized protein n=1 Tax=Thiogranum longum TaxID=1537524 RepID=A0A4R1HD02_9GAMM|nr:hypothetical protein DFR30_1809 [Thiogranum longum]